MSTFSTLRIFELLQIVEFFFHFYAPAQVDFCFSCSFFRLLFNTQQAYEPNVCSVKGWTGNRYESMCVLKMEETKKNIRKILVVEGGEQI